MQGTTPIIDVLDWRVSSQTPIQLVYRPGPKVLFRRGLLAAIMIAVTVSAYYGIATAMNPAEVRASVREALAPMAQEMAVSIPPGMTQAQWERAQEQNRQRIEEIRQDRLVVRTRVLWVAQAALGGLIALMLLLPASVFWNRVVLAITPQRELEMRRWMLWPRCVRVALADLNRLAYGAQEINQRTTTRQIVGRYWRWSVQLQSGDAVGGQTVAIFYPCYQPDRPGKSEMPPEITTIIQWLCAHVPLQVVGPFFRDTDSGRGRRSHVGDVLPRSVATVRQSDESPHAPGRAKLMHAPEHTSHHIEVVDQHGARRTYDSRHALPEHIRRTLPAENEAFGQGAFAQRIVIRNADGTETHYNSLDELPPDLRARFEAARNARRQP